MDKSLPSRPNLEHLKRQAKALLAGFKAREPEAMEMLRKHLPAAADLDADAVSAMPLKLADAQSGIARSYGFSSWPNLVRHVETIRTLEGTWVFQRLEIDGVQIPPAAIDDARLHIDGDRFRAESPDSQGVIVINLETEPHQIELKFVEGPEAGNSNFGIFRLHGDQFDLCLDMNGKPAPLKFATAHGSGRAFETLKRISAQRPGNVTGGKPSASKPAAVVQPRVGFEFVASETLSRLAGEWSAVQLLLNGKPLPEEMLRTGQRSMNKNEIKISYLGKTVIRALMRINEETNPMQLDYYNLEGVSKGAIQQGIMKWIGDEICACMSASGQPRPTDFTCPPGSGRTFSQWRRKT